MGNFFSNPQIACTQLLDTIQMKWQSIALLSWYVLAIGLVVWGVVALAMQDPAATSPAAVGWIMPLLTTITHVGILVGSMVLVPTFVPYPVEPRVAFVSSDAVVGILLGLAIGGLAANSFVLLMIVNGLLVVPFGLMCYKYVQIIADVQTGTRDAVTGDDSLDYEE